MLNRLAACSLFEDEARAQVDGHGAGAGGGVGGGAGVQRQGVESGVWPGRAGHGDRACKGGAGIVGYIESQPSPACFRSQPAMKVTDILRVKGNTLYTVTPDQPLAEAVQTMAELDIGSLVVMEHGDLVGMLTFREVIAGRGRQRRQRRPATGALGDGRRAR
jgi:hypothetical protein